MLELGKFVKQHKPGIILITEARIPQNANAPHIPGYHLLATRKTLNKHGIAVFIHKQINYTEVNIQTNKIETVAIKTAGITVVCGPREHIRRRKGHIGGRFKCTKPTMEMPPQQSRWKTTRNVCRRK